MPRRRLVSACDQKNEPMIFLSSGAHSKPKLKLTLALDLVLVLGFIQSYDHICNIKFQGLNEQFWDMITSDWDNETNISVSCKMWSIEFQSDDITKMIFLKLWVLFDCSEQPIIHTQNIGSLVH